MKIKGICLLAALMAGAAGISRGEKPMSLVLSSPDEIALSNDTATLTVYRPGNPNGMFILDCPGGGYNHLAINKEGHDMAGWMNARGITFGVLKYRMPKGDGVHLPLLDAEKAMAAVRDSAASWHLDPDRIGVMGFSAGGHLAASLSNIGDPNLRPAFTILFYPVISMEKGVAHSGTRRNLIGGHPSEEMVEKYSIDRQVTKRTPPAIMFLSSDDGVSPVNSLRYFDALRLKKIPVGLHVYPSGKHGWGFSDSFLYKPQWTAELEKWLGTL